MPACPVAVDELEAGEVGAARGALVEKVQSISLGSSGVDRPKAGRCLGLRSSDTKKAERRVGRHIALAAAESPFAPVSVPDSDSVARFASGGVPPLPWRLRLRPTWNRSRARKAKSGGMTYLWEKRGRSTAPSLERSAGAAEREFGDFGWPPR